MEPSPDTSEMICEPAPSAGIPAPDKVYQVVRWLLSGNREIDIVAAIVGQWPDEPIGPLIGAAMDDLAKTGQWDVDVVRGWCFAACMDVYRRMMEMKAYPDALRAIKMLADMAGVKR